MNKLGWLLLAGTVVVVLGLGWVGYILLQSRSDEPGVSGDTVGQLLDVQSEQGCGLVSAETVASSAQVQIDDKGFEPNEVSMKVGQTVQWVNRGSKPHVVSSYDHPEHHDCVGLKSDEIAPGEEFRFTFTKPGVWHYRDGTNPSAEASIAVTE